MKKIVVTRADGGVSVIWPGDKATPETMLKDAQAVPGYVSHREVDDTVLPQDRMFRNAWTDNFNTPTVDVDIQKGIQVVLAEVRRDRQGKFEALGFPFQLDPSVEKAVVPTDKQKQLQDLRDITNPIKAITKTGKAEDADLQQLTQYFNLLK